MVCTITNTAVSPVLTLIKVVDNGTTAATGVPTDWTLTANGPTPISGKTGAGTITAAPVQVGTYTLSESGPPGYEAGQWTCTGATVAGAAVTLAEGDEATCTITNTAVAGVWELTKLADPVSGSTVAPGSVIKYTLVAAHESGAPIEGATASDDLSKVLPYVQRSSAAPSGVDAVRQHPHVGGADDPRRGQRGGDLQRDREARRAWRHRLQHRHAHVTRRSLHAVSQRERRRHLGAGPGPHRPRAEHRLVGGVLVEVDEHPRAPLLLPPRRGDQVGAAAFELAGHRHRRRPHLVATSQRGCRRT